MTTYIEQKYLHLVASFIWCLVQKLKMSSIAEMLVALQNTPDVMPKTTWAPWLQWYNMKPMITEQYLMGQFSKFVGETIPNEIQLMPPNCVAALVHWRPLSALMQMLPKDCHHELQSLTTLSDGTGKCVEEVPTVSKPVMEVVNAHMHLDKFVADTGRQNIHMERLTSLNCCPTPPVNVSFYVVNSFFCHLICGDGNYSLK